MIQLFLIRDYSYSNSERICHCSGEATTSSEQMAADMELGVKATLAVLAMKPHVAEADNPLLCESIRRARSELTLSLLLKFRNDQGMLRDILNALLDQVEIFRYSLI